MTRSAIDRDRLMGEATEWLARLNGDQVGTATRSHFMDWLLRSYGNVDAFLTASLVLAEISFVQALPSVEELARDVRDEPKNSNVIHLRPTHEEYDESELAVPQNMRRRSIFRYAAAASAAAVAGALGLLTLRSWDEGQAYSTAVGEQRSFGLEDGSTIHLNTDTALTVKFEKSARQITLVRGEARFEVAKDVNRPFLVTTPQAVVRALGTAFNVRIIEQETVVSVIEGHIRVVKREADAFLRPGSQATAEAMELKENGQVAVTENAPMRRNGGPPFKRAVGWMQRRIILDDDSLGTLVAEFNRYNKQPLEIGDPELANYQIFGSFDPFDRASLLDYLRRYQGVIISKESGRLVMHLAPNAPREP